MTAFLDALGDLIGLTEPHLDEYDGTEYTTPSLIDHDEQEEACAPSRTTAPDAATWHAEN